jgi:2'-5' RNA ligase
MRTFIAIELSDRAKETLTRVQSHLKYSDADVKWVEPANVHLTLKFLGEIDEKTCEKVKSILDEIAKTTKPFEMSLESIGAFPSIDFPRVIWVGIDKGAKESTELANKITAEFSTKIGFNKEARDFAAHLTIGRVRSGKNKQALKEKIILYALLPTLREEVSSVILFQSKLTPTGPIYTRLHEAKFS